MKLFLDANVLIDFILERPKFYPAAAMIISYAVEGKIRICASSMSIVTSCFICVERCDMELADFRKKIDFLSRLSNLMYPPHLLVKYFQLIDY